MAQSNGRVAAALREFAELLAISDGDPYRVRLCAWGWVGPDAVINPYPIAQLRRFLRKPPQRPAAWAGG